MATIYTPSAYAAQSPSSAPGPGVVPLDSLPQDVDGWTVANFYQSLKSKGDFITWIQKSIALCPPAPSVSTTMIGYTSTTRTGAGTGTITPATGPTGNTYSGYNFVFKIILGGVTTTATFQWSSDGGTTFSATQTTSASFALGSTGVTVVFAGTFVATDTYQFQQVFTPLSRWLDLGGKGRFLVDHNGFPLGRLYRHQEQYRIQHVAAQIASPVTNYGWMKATINATGTYRFALTHGSSGLFNLNTTVLANGDQAFLYQDGYVAQPIGGQACVVVLEWEHINSVSLAGSNCNVFMGLTQDTDDTSTSAIWFKFLGAGTFWQAETIAGAATTVATAVTGVSAAHRFRIEIHSASSPFGTLMGSPIVLFFIDEQLVATSTTNLTGNKLRPIFGTKSTGACTNVSSFSAYDVAVNRVDNSLL